MIGLGALFAGILAFANQKLRIEEDPKIEELTQELPGLNCGACGFPSCHEFAAALIAKKEAALNTTCRVASGETMEVVSKISGVKEDLIKEVAVVFCGAEDKDKTKKAVYKGINTCRSANVLSGGGMNCEYGCLGFGDCVEACAFDAIKMIDGLPKVDLNKCVGCGKCIKACPRGIIELMPADTANLVVVACSSKEKGPAVRKICRVGCIGCKICEKLSGGVFVVRDNCSRLDVKRMKENIKWNEIIKKCPTKSIVRVK